MANRLIELAIEALENQRSVIDKEITALRAGDDQCYASGQQRKHDGDQKTFDS